MYAVPTLGEDFEQTVFFRFAQDSFCRTVEGRPPRNARWWELFRASSLYKGFKNSYISMLTKEAMAVMGNDVRGIQQQQQQKEVTAMKTVTIQPFHGAPITLPWHSFAQAIDRFEINHEDWACSDYARRFHGFVAYLRHFSDGEFSSFGQFVTPFMVTSADIPLPDDVSSELALRLRSDALLWFATKVLAARNVNGVVSTSGEFAGEWFTTTAINVDQVLRERGFPF